MRPWVVIATPHRSWQSPACLCLNSAKNLKEASAVLGFCSFMSRKLDTASPSESESRRVTLGDCGCRDPSPYPARSSAPHTPLVCILERLHPSIHPSIHPSPCLRRRHGCRFGRDSDGSRPGTTVTVHGHGLRAEPQASLAAASLPGPTRLGRTSGDADARDVAGSPGTEPWWGT